MHTPQLVSVAEYRQRSAVGVQQQQLSNLSTDSTRKVVFRYVAQRAHVLGSAGIAVTSDGYVLRESVLHEDISAELSTISFEGGKVQSIAGEALSLCGKWHTGFWHWMYEALPNLIMAEASAFSGRYIIPQGAPFIRESLELLGISHKRIVVHSEQALLVEQLHIPQKRNGWLLFELPEVVLDLRHRLLSGALTDIPTTQLSTLPRRLYISRNGGAKTRRVVNEEEILPFLQRFEIVPLRLEALTLREQILLVSQAEALIGPHGAGMAHSLFIKPRSYILEFFSPRYVNATILAAIKVLSHRYSMLTSYTAQGEYQFGDDIGVCTGLLEAVLEGEFLNPKA